MKNYLLKQRASSPESVAEHGLTSPIPLWVWSQWRTPMATMAVRCCFHDAKEWLASWIRTVLSDSAGGETVPHLGEETLAGCEMLPNKVILRVIVRPVTRPPPIEKFTALPRDTYKEYWVWIYPLFEMGVWLSLCLPLCEVVVNLQTTMSWFEKGIIQDKISKDTHHSMDISVLTVKNNLMPINWKWSFWSLRNQRINL